MWARQLGLTWTQAGLVVVSAVGIYLTAVVYSRVVGQRAFAQLSTFDIAATVAFGAIMGRVVLVHTSLLAGALGLATLFATQAVVGYLRQHLDWARVVDNRPILLMAGPRFIPDNLRRAHATEDEIRERVRLAGVGRLEEVRCVVMERNGQISVIAGDGELDARLFKNVTGRRHLEELPGSGSGSGSSSRR